MLKYEIILNILNEIAHGACVAYLFQLYERKKLFLSASIHL